LGHPTTKQTKNNEQLGEAFCCCKADSQGCRGMQDKRRPIQAGKEFDNKTLEIFKELLEDPSLEVRTILLTNLPKIISYSKPQNEKLVRSIITLCLEKGPDFIRAQAVTSILSLAEIEKSSAQALLKTAASLSDWRVRYA